MKKALLLALLLALLISGAAGAESAQNYPQNAHILQPDGCDIRVSLPVGWVRYEDDASPFTEYISAEKDVSVAFYRSGDSAEERFSAARESFAAGEPNFREQTETQINGRICLLYIDENDQRCAYLRLDDGDALYVSSSEIGDEGVFLMAVLESITPLQPKTENCTFCHDTMLCQKCNGKRIPCDSCNGKGVVDCFICGGGGNCTSCHGMGWFPSFNRKTGTTRRDCRICRGSGNCKTCGGQGEQTCKRCDGSGEDECIYCDGKGTCPYCR